MHLEDIMKQAAKLRSFPAAVAVLVTEADRRGATWIEVQFRMDRQLCIRDDGRAFTADEQAVLAAIGAGHPIPDLGDFDANALIGFIYHVASANFYSWPADGMRLAAWLHIATGTRNPELWSLTPIPHAPNDQPPHGVEIRWTDAPSTVDRFSVLQHEMAAFLTPEGAAKVHLRTPSLHGHRPLIT